jgi:hypothetical protein
VLLSRWRILRQPCRLRERGGIAAVMKACIIMHNIIYEYRRYGYQSRICDPAQSDEGRTTVEGKVLVWQRKDVVEASLPPVGLWGHVVAQRHDGVVERSEHEPLTHDLVEHTCKR